MADFARGDLAFARPGAGIGWTQAHPGVQLGAEVELFPGRLYNWQAAPLDQLLRAALVADPSGLVGCVSLYVAGRRFRWSSRSVAIPCAAVHGGALWFEGRLLGDGEYVSSVNLDERSFDVPTFSVESDNELLLGILPGSEAGSSTDENGGFVNTLTGSYVEISLAHTGADWSTRYVVIRGTLSSVSYGPKGSTLKFTVVPFWRSLDARIAPTITRENFPNAHVDNFGKTIPIIVGSKEIGSHRVYKIIDLPTVDHYVVSVGTPLANVIIAEKKDETLVVIFDVYHRKDGEGRTVEVLTVRGNNSPSGTGTDNPELYVTVDTTDNGFLDMDGAGGDRINARGIARGIAYLIARYAQVDGSDVDFSGLMQHATTHLSRYGISIDDETSMRDLLVDRLSPQTDGMFTIRRGRLAFVGLPNFDIYPQVQPTPKAHLRFGVDLLSFTDLTEPGPEGLVSSISGEWDFRANKLHDLDGGVGPGYLNAEGFIVSPVTPEITATSSFWFRIGESLHGKSQSVKVSAPDLALWRDLRSAIRFEEIVRSRILRQIDYTATAVRTLGLYPGDFVTVTHEDQNFDAKLFLVSNVGVRLRPIVRLGLIEWPLAQDHFGAYGGVNLTEI